MDKFQTTLENVLDDYNLEFQDIDDDTFSFALENGSLVNVDLPEIKSTDSESAIRQKLLHNIQQALDNFNARDEAEEIGISSDNYDEVLELAADEPIATKTSSEIIRELKQLPDYNSFQYEQMIYLKRLSEQMIDDGYNHSQLALMKNYARFAGLVAESEEFHKALVEHAVDKHAVQLVPINFFQYLDTTYGQDYLHAFNERDDCEKQQALKSFAEQIDLKLDI